MVVEEVVDEYVGGGFAKTDVTERGRLCDGRRRRRCLRRRLRHHQGLLYDRLTTLASLARHELVVDNVAFVEVNGADAADKALWTGEAVVGSVVATDADCIDVGTRRYCLLK